jgi:hypothetical protein
MKYFIDTEFKEQPSNIDLISIGIVAEDGRNYYAICNEFDIKKAWKDEWLRYNVLNSIYSELYKKLLPNERKATLFREYSFSLKDLSRLVKRFGKSKRKIASEIVSFINTRDSSYYYGIGLNSVIRSITNADVWNKLYYPKEFEYIEKHNTFIPEFINSTGMDGKGESRNREIIYNQPEFYGYYADYDWVVFCWLFGRMIDLPKGFPMYCRDLKQMTDERGLDKEWKRINCPDPEGEHNALIDALWNKQLYEKIVSTNKKPKP